MSKQIDERVVEMRFDNRQFESNVKTTMSTLDKLKEKLNFKGAEKGLDGISKAAKNVDLSEIGKSAEKVGLKFDAMYTIADQALRNITNSAMHAGKKIISALTIDPIKTGFQEYETQINAVQTILANTQSKGTTLDQVNAALDTLNTYADKTIYNFTEMTRNIGTFTAAGVDLDTSVNAIQGIANLAAVSGSTSQQASTAMYQLSQALAAGTVKLMDWNSVVNAGMGGQVFQDALMETARVHGIAIDEMIESEGSFRETLKDEWLTAEILTETLQKFTLTTEGLTEAEIEQNREMLRGKGYTEEQIDAIFKLGETATDAATKVKTFSQMWDVIKESVQSGWAQTWRLIFGDFEEAKAIFTPLTNFFTNFIGKMSDARNKLIEGALGKTFSDLAQKIQSITEPIKSTVNGVKDAVKSLEDYSKVVDEIIRGDWGVTTERWDALTEAGYDWAHAQNLVNEKLGDSTRHATDYKEAQKELATANKEVTVSQAERLEQLTQMSDVELKAMGFAKEQITAIREVEAEANKLGMGVSEFVSQIDELDGRTILINSFKNSGQGLTAILTSIGKAWRDTFDPMTSEQLYNIIAAIHDFSTHLRVGDETAKNIMRTFRGLFSALDIVLTIVGGPIKIAFKALFQLLGMFDMFDDGIWSVTAAIGDVITGLKKGIDSVLDFTKVFEFIIPYIKSAAETINGWIDQLKAGFSGMAPDIIAILKELGSRIKDWVLGLKDSFANIAPDLIAGLKNGFGDGANSFIQKIIDFGRKIIDSIKNVLGIHSPSTEFYEIGTNIISGLINGLQNGVSKVLGFMKDLGKSIAEWFGNRKGGLSFDWSGFMSKFTSGIKKAMSATLGFIKNVFSKCVEFIKGIDLGSVMSVVISTGLIVTLKKMTDIVGMFAKPFEGLGEMFEGLGDMLTGLGKKFKAQALEAKSKALLNFAKSIAILVASLYVLTLIDPSELKTAITTLITLSIVILALSAASSLIGGKSKGLAKMSLVVVGISAALFIMAGAIKKLAGIDADKSNQVITMLASMVGAIGIIIGVMSACLNGKSEHDVKQFSKLLMKIASAMLLLAIVAKIIAGMSFGDMIKAAIGMTGLVVVVTTLTTITKLAGKDVDKAGITISKIAGAMLMLAITAKIVATMSWGDMGKAAVGLLGLVGIVALLILVTNLAENNIDSIGKTIAGIAGAMLALTVVALLISGMSWGGMVRAAVGMVGLVGVIYLLVGLVKTIEKDAPKIAITLLALSVSIGILGAVAVMLSMISVKGLAKGVIAIYALGSIMAGMVKATQNAQNCKGNLIVMSVAIAVMAASIAALSLIDGNKLTGATIALGSLMGIFGILIKVAGTAQSSMGSLIVMTVAIGLLGGMIYLLSTLPVESVIGTSASLSVLLLSLSGSLALISKFGTLSAKSLLSLGVMTAIIYILSSILRSLAELPIESTMAATKALCAVLLSMVTAMGILALVGLGGPAVFVGIGAIVAFIAAVAGVMYALGALITPEMEETVNRGIAILTNLATGLGEAIAGFAVGLMSGLPQIGMFLSQFMTGAMPFINGIKMVDESAAKGAALLAVAILTITAADLINGVMTFLSGGSSLPQLGAQLSSFMMNAMPFMMGASMLTPEMTEGVKNLAQAILVLTAADVVNGLTSWLTGGSSLADFGTQLAEFGPGMKAYADSVAGIDSAAVEASANATKALAEMANELPNSGGWLGKIVGENDIGDFAEGLVPFAKGLKSYSNAVVGVKAEPIHESAKAAKALAEMANEMPNSGGWLGKIVGDNDLADFAKGLLPFGIALKTYSLAVIGINPDSVKTSVEAAKAVISFANEIPNSGGLASIFAGDNGIAAFGKSLIAFGTSIKSYSLVVAGVNSGALNTSIADVIKLAAMIKGIQGLDGDSAKGFEKAITNLGKMGINGFITAISNAVIEIPKRFSLVTKSAIAAIKSKYTDYKNSGKYLVEGFAKGISDSKFKAEIAARAMAKAAKTAADNELNINSPSKVFMKTGGSVVEGFAKGITDNLGDVKDAAVNMSNAVLTATQKELQINSPSLVFDKKVGRYIVQGIAEGITKETKAEEAAEKKAQNIVSAFQKEFDRLSVNSEIAKTDFDIWSATTGKNATPEVIDAKELEYYNAELKRATEKKSLAYNEWAETNEYLKKKQVTAQAERDAWKKYRDAELETANINNSIAEIKERAIERAREQEYNKLETAKEIRDSEYEIWKLSNDKSTTDTQKDQRYLKYLNDNLADLNKQVQLNVNDYNEAIKKYGKESEEALDALNKCYKTDIEIAETQAAIARVSVDAAEKQKSIFQEAIDARNKEHDIWEKEHLGASASEKDATNLERLKANLSDLNNNLTIAKANYTRIVELYGEASDEAKNAANEIRDIRSDIADANSEIANIQEDAKQRALELNELKSSNIDLEYQLWEKTTGRKAASTERDLMKISTLTRQMSEQSVLLENSRDKWRDACTKYGEYSNEAQDAYTTYLNKQLDIANIQNEILDIEERAETKQKNALKDYDDYIKKYKKYYLQNGMTEADLIKDAKLVSGYDPDNTVKNIAERTKAAIDNIQKSDLYNEVINGFNDMGSSYVSAVYEGITTESSSITTAMTTMINACANSIKEERSKWVSLGNDLAQGLVEGIYSKLNVLTKTVEQLMTATIVTGEATLEIHSPSRVFANMGRYAVMGLAQGLIENSKLSNTAASEVASGAVENLRNTISHISETLDADMDTQPTIRPVLDLSNVKTGVARLNTMISTSQAMGISASMSGDRTDTSQNGSHNNNSGNTYQYTQYNYSPKALSRTEIYRQTRSLLATKKGAHA